MKKTAHYRRVIWFSDSPRPLGTVLKEFLDKVPTTELPPVFSHANEYDCVIARRSIANEPLFLQFVVYERGAPAAIIPEATAVEALEAGIANPPEGTEFIQSQLFCIVRGNDVLWTSHNTPLREGKINLLFAELIQSLGSHETKFGLQAKLDEKAFGKAFKLGIAEIDLGVGDFKPVLEALISPSGIPGLEALKSLVTKKPSTAAIRAAADVQGRMVLKPGRRWSRPHVKTLLSNMASNVLSSHEGEFVIVTKGGIRITQRKMSVHKEYDVHGDKQILNPLACQGKLASVLHELDIAGLLE